jgi:hypothetical protein
MDKDTLVSLEVSRRREKLQKLQKLKENPEKQMKFCLIQSDSKNFNQSVSATHDRYMIDALNKVRESDVTLPEDLTRMNGTWMRNQSSK